MPRSSIFVILPGMSRIKLAEALALRADATTKVEALRSRIVDNARHQEGEEPAEDASALLVDVETALGDLESLIQRINRTNAATPLGEGTITDAIAHRDVLRLRHGVLTAAGRNQGGYGRQFRSELRYLSALPVAELRSRADRVTENR